MSCSRHLDRVSRSAFSAATRPWLGYLMLLEDCSKSTMPVAVKQPHFPVFPEFMNASYAERYRYLLSKLVRERLYDSACFLTSSFERGMKGRIF
ncbi:MAG: PaeR7I family type II restriction endonuclease [Pirellulaceae bacterium]